MIGNYNDVKADIKVKNGDTIKCGNTIILNVFETPGHTANCVSYYDNNKTMIFTGDALFVRGCGRTDFQGGSAATLYDSVTTKIFKLPDSCRIFPAHDYKGRMFSTIKEEIKYNPRLGGGKTKKEFVDIMSKLNLSNPSKMHFAVPCNRLCGYPDDVKKIMDKIKKDEAARKNNASV